MVKLLTNFFVVLTRTRQRTLPVRLCFSNLESTIPLTTHSLLQTCQSLEGCERGSSSNELGTKLSCAVVCDRSQNVSPRRGAGDTLSSATTRTRRCRSCGASSSNGASRVPGGEGFSRRMFFDSTADMHRIGEAEHLGVRLPASPPPRRRRNLRHRGLKNGHSRPAGRSAKNRRKPPFRRLEEMSRFPCANRAGTTKPTSRPQDS